ncbi:type II toxin-antitoxin system ParD family antitoxin [Marinobacter sp. OP 3.4]|uniref:type II toxin-antitoxin system ParD family antitoxin n=1 Tax=Marinobacter sp. OP 3.4 TaxID=3076501 RepID=UPI002E1EC40B
MAKIGNNCHSGKVETLEVPMATMNVSLPEPMKDWVEAQTRTGRYANTSDYVRDLIRKDQDRADKIARMQQLVNEGLESGDGSRTMDELREHALRMAKG